MGRNIKGFSLIEMAIVMVIFGLVLASASSILTLFVNRGGSEKTRQMIASDKSALISFVQKDKNLPEQDDFSTSVSYPQDSFNHQFFYYADPILDKTMSGWNLGDLTDINTVCGSGYTNTEVWICNNANCADAADYVKISNIAFVIASGGENKVMQTTDNNGIIKVYPQGTDAIVSSSDANLAMKYDDIVDWMSLDELRSKVGCDGESIRFVTQAMPYAQKDTAYSVRLYVEGGIPYANGSTAEYGFKIEDDNDNAQLITDGLHFYFSASDSDELKTTASTYEKGQFVRIAGNSSNFSQQTYKITIEVQDKAQKAKSEDTKYSRTFILNAAN
ncbi:MAG: type II secretion system protein [Deferribacterales bacterium]